MGKRQRSRGRTAAGACAALFRLNYTVTPGGQRRNSANKRGRKTTHTVKRD